MKNISLIKNLQREIKSKIFTEGLPLDFYSVDSSSYKIKPMLVCIPENEAEVSKIVKFASKNKIAITTRGAGTGLVGGALGDGIVIDMQKFQKITVKDNFVEVEAGVLKGKLDAELKKHGKFLGPNPSIGAHCAVGGMVSANSSGSRSIKYGSIIDNLLHVRIILANGKTIILPDDQNIGKNILSLIKGIDRKKFPQVSKNSCGYRIDAVTNLNDTQKIIAGSEGTLGIIVSARLKTFDEPKKRVLCVIAYDSVFDAAKNCPDINMTGPSSLEFVDKNTMKNFGYKFPNSSKCLLFVEYDDKINEKIQDLKKIVSGKFIIKTIVDKEIKKWWKYRDSSLSFSLRQIRKDERAPHIIEDAAVPIKELGNLLKTIYKIKKFFPCKVIVYGHAGNGNLHVRLISKIKNKKVIQNIAEFYFNEVIKLGGTITGEHGDGLARSEFVKMVYGKTNYDIFKKLKNFFDKDCILNPNKVIAKKNTMIRHLFLG